MKKYIKPEIQIYNFKVENVVMTGLSPTPTPAGVMMSSAAAASVVSANYSDYIPDSVDNKVWTSYDDENWNWEE